MRKKNFLKLLVCTGTIAILLSGCNNPQQPTDTKTETEYSYSQQEVNLIKEVLGCDGKRAEAILEMLEDIEIHEVVKAEETNSTDGFAFSMIDEHSCEYEVFVDKNYHLYAVKDVESGDYIYTEYE